MNNDLVYRAAKEAMFLEMTMAIAEDPNAVTDILYLTFSAGQLDGATAALATLRTCLDAGLTGQQALQQAYDELMSIVGQATGTPVDVGDIH